MHLYHSPSPLYCPLSLSCLFIMPYLNDYVYDHIPDLYDFEYPECAGPELDFWDLLAGQADGPVLELAVGTGRIALPLACLGHEVWGVDTSEPMLARARAKMSRMPTSVGARLHLSAQSMSSFSLPERFGLIYAPFNSFLLLDPESEAKACLGCAHGHLKPGGKLVIDAFVPGPDDFLPDVENLTYLELHPETGARVTRQRHYEYDSSKGIATSNITYTLEIDSHPPQIHEFSYYLYLYSHEQLVACLNNCGFQVLQTSGDYLGHPHERPEDNLILICQSSR